MPDFNDVVRHVILRIVVDSAGLAEELAKARAQLKAAETGEKEANKRRAKDAEQVTHAYERQNEALRKNAEAHGQLAKATDRSSQEQSERIKKSTQDIHTSTREQIADLKEVERLKERDHQRELARLKAESSAQAQYDKTIAESAERMSREQQKLDQELAERRKAAEDAAKIRKATRGTRAETEEHLARESGRRATAEADRAEYVADIARSEALDRANERITNSIRRRRSLEAEEQRARQELNRLTEAANRLDERGLGIAERRTRVVEQYSRRRGITGAFQTAGALAADTTIGLARAVFSAPRSAARAGREFDAREFDDVGRAATRAEQIVSRLWTKIGEGGVKATDGIRKVADAFRNMERAQPRVTGATLFGGLTVELPRVMRAFEGLAGVGSRVSGFFRRMATDAETGGRSLQRFRAQVSGFFADINRARAGGSGGSLVGDFVGKITAGLDTLNGAFSGFSRHLISFQNLVLLIVAALGPLSAMLGAVGAAALGLVSDFASLAGSLVALPGLISAVVGAFGTLYLVMQPLTKVFAAYKEMQNQAALATNKSSKAYIDAANAVIDAQRRLDDARIAHQRAIEDEPRAELALHDARKQAKRDLDDLHEAYQKLKFDEEGAQLDVDSAKQAYKRALVDPTANKLDRAIARHNYEGALWDQRDQAKNAQRTQEDYAEALKKGVDGMDAVVQALRDLADAKRNITNTSIDQTRAQQDLTQAQAAHTAGTQAALTAQQAYEAQLARLGPLTRQFVESLKGIKGMGGDFKQLQKDLSDNIFGKLLDDVPKLRDGLDEIRSFLMPTADAFGNLAHQALTLFTNSEWKKFFSEQGTENGKIIQGLGTAALNLADAFKGVIEAARPFTEFVVDGIKKATGSLDIFFNSAEGKEKTGNFLKLTEQRLGEVWKMLKNLAGGFAGFFRALNTKGKDDKEDFTTWLNNGLINATKHFEELGKNASDPNSGFMKWLHDIRPLVHDVAEFFAAIGRAFGKMFSDKSNLDEASKILKNLSEVWLPKLAEFFDNLSKSGTLSKVTEAIGHLVGGLTDLSKSGALDAFSKFAGTLDKIASVLETVVGWLSQFPALIKPIAALIGGVLSASLIAKISKPVRGAFQFGRNLFRSVPNSYEDVDEDTTPSGKGKGEPGVIGPTGRAGGEGVKGNRADTSGGESGGRIRRLWRRYRDSTDQEPPLTPVQLSRREATTGGRPGTVASTRPSRWSVLTGNIKDQITGDTKVEPTLARMENYLRLIEINTRRGGGGAGGRPYGGTGGGGGGLPTGGGGTAVLEEEEKRTGLNRLFGPRNETTSTPSRRRRFFGRTGITTAGAGTQLPGFGEAVRDVVDPGRPTPSPVSESLGSSGRTPYGPIEDVRNLPGESPAAAARRTRTTAATTTGYSEERKQQNIRREKVDLPPLPPDIVTPRRARTTTPSGITGITPGSTSKATHTFETASPELLPEEELPPARHPGITAAPSVVEGEEFHPAPTPMPGVRPMPPGPPAPVSEIEPTPTRLQLTAPSTQLALPPGTVPAPRGPGGRFRPVAPGESRPTTARRDRFGRYRQTTTVVQPRGTGGRFRETLPGETTATPARGPGGRFIKTTTPIEEETPPLRGPGGRFVTTKELPEATPTPPRVIADVDDTGAVLPTTSYADVNVPTREQIVNAPQPREKGRFGKKPKIYPNKQEFTTFTPIDIDQIPVAPEKPARGPGGRFISKIKDIAFPKGDEGSFGGFGLGDRRSTRGKRHPQVRHVPSTTPGPQAPSILSDIAATGGEGFDYDEGFNAGYQDAISELSGGGGGSGVDLPDIDTGEEEDGRRGTVAEEEGQGRGRRSGRGIPAEERPRGRFGRGARAVGRGAKGLAKLPFKAVGGIGRSLGRGLLGGIASGGIGMVAGMAAQIGGDALIGKFVKNKDDQASLSRGLGAVATGASIGAMFGPAGAAVGGAIGGIYSLFKDKNLRDFVEKKLGSLGKTIWEGLQAAAGKIGEFFTKTMPHWLEGLIKFFSVTLPTAIGKAFLWLIKKAGEAVLWVGKKYLELLKFWYIDLPIAIGKAFLWLLKKAGEGVEWVANKLLDLLKFFFVDLPQAIGKGFGWLVKKGVEAVDWLVKKAGDFIKFWTVDVPQAIGKFFTDTLPKFAKDGFSWFKKNLIDPIVDFFTKTIPDFFTKSIPNLLAQLISWLPGWAKKLLHISLPGVAVGKMSGGVIEGVYQGIEDHVRILATPGEFMMRKRAVDEPGAKAILTDWNEGRIKVSDLVGGLAAATAPPVMSIVAPDTANLTGRVPTVVNHTVNHAPVFGGDVTINNPVREKTEYSLRRQLQVSANRHRR